MKLFKVRKKIGNRSKSLIAKPSPSFDPLDPDQASHYQETWNMLRAMGFTDTQIIHMLTVYFNHATKVQGLDVQRAWMNVNSSVSIMYDSWANRIVSPWVAFFAAYIAIAFVALILIDPTFESTITELTPDTYYVMQWDNLLWCAELYQSVPETGGVYELAGEIGPRLLAHQKHIYIPGGYVDDFWFMGSLVRSGRVGIWHEVIQWQKWEVDFVGFLTEVNNRMYRLRKGYEDHYLPSEPFFRSGGLYGTSDYAGIFLDYDCI